MQITRKQVWEDLLNTVEHAQLQAFEAQFAQLDFSHSIEMSLARTRRALRN